jgi:hypothetical protein
VHEPDAVQALEGDLVEHEDLLLAGAKA